MKSTSHWVIFCIASVVLAMTTLVPFLWTSRPSFLTLVDRHQPTRIADQERRSDTHSEQRVDLADAADASVEGPIQDIQPLVVIPTSATRSPAVFEDTFPLLPLPFDSPQWIAAGFEPRPSRSPRPQPLRPRMETTAENRSPGHLHLRRPSGSELAHMRYTAVLERSSVAVSEEGDAWEEARWVYPGELVEQFTAVCQSAASQAWLARLEAALLELSQTESLADPTSAQLLLDLGEVVKQAPPAETAAEDAVSQASFEQAQDSLDRRFHVWQLLQQASRPAEGPEAERLPDNDVLLERIQQRLAGADSRQGWVTYLQLEELEETLTAPSVEPQLLQQLAHTVLERMSAANLSEAQKEMLAEPVFISLRQRLCRVVSEPVSIKLLLLALERFEQNGSRRAARQLALSARQLQWSPSPPLASLSRWIERTYRQGNLQFQVTETLINRLLPEPVEQTSPINSQLLGTQMRGEAMTRAGLRILLLPDDSRWHIGIEANGIVQSQTRSQAGVATFYNDGESTFRVSKQLLVSPQQLEVRPAMAVVEANSELSDIKTEYDSMPLLGGIARNVARNQFRRKSRGGVAQLEQHLAETTERALDEQVAQRLESVDTLYRERWLNPLEGLELAPTVMALQTRDEALQLQYRIASEVQLAGFGRPPALPANSLMHLRLHESALNNLVEQLQLSGTRATLPALWAQVGEVLGKEVVVPEDLPEDVIVELAPVSAVRVQLRDGQFQLELNVRSLERKKETLWRNFSIVAYYRPDQAGALLRDGHLSVIGKSIRLGDRVALQGIFNKVFSRIRPIRVLDQQLVSQLDSAAAAVGSATVQNGWLSISIVDRK